MGTLSAITSIKMAERQYSFPAGTNPAVRSVTQKCHVNKNIPELAWAAKELCGCVSTSTSPLSPPLPLLPFSEHSSKGVGSRFEYIEHILTGYDHRLHCTDYTPSSASAFAHTSRILLSPHPNKRPLHRTSNTHHSNTPSLPHLVLPLPRVCVCAYVLAVLHAALTQ